MTWWESVISAVVVIGGAWLTARYAARSADRATHKSAEVQQEHNAITGYAQLVDDLHRDVKRLREEVQELREDMSTLKQQRVRDRTMIRHLIEYARLLRAVLANAGLPVPEMTAGIDLDDPELLEP